MAWAVISVRRWRHRVRPAAFHSLFEPRQGQLPKDCTKFENTLLEDLLRVFASETLRTASGDVFGRINEYFLMKFAMQGAQDNGEFFTPPPAVRSAGRAQPSLAELGLGNPRMGIPATYAPLILPRGDKMCEEKDRQ